LYSAWPISLSTTSFPPFAILWPYINKSAAVYHLVFTDLLLLGNFISNFYANLFRQYTDLAKPEVFYFYYLFNCLQIIQLVHEDNTLMILLAYMMQVWSPGLARFLMAQPLALKNHPGLFHYPRISLLARNSLLLLNRNPKNSKAGQCSIAPARQVPASL
jgi:hypothetical protein